MTAGTWLVGLNVENHMAAGTDGLGSDPSWYTEFQVNVMANQAGTDDDGDGLADETGELFDYNTAPGDGFLHIPAFEDVGDSDMQSLFTLASDTSVLVRFLWMNDASVSPELDTNIQINSVFFTQPVPEPGTLILLGTGLAGMALAGRRRRRRR